MKDNKLGDNIFIDCYRMGYLLKENKIDKVAILNRFSDDRFVTVLYFYDGKVQETKVFISEEECKVILHASAIEYLVCKTRTEAEYFVLYGNSLWKDVWVKIQIENKKSYTKGKTNYWLKENYYYLPKLDLWLLHYTATMLYSACPICDNISLDCFHKSCDKYELLSTQIIKERLITADRNPNYDWMITVFNIDALYSENLKELKPFMVKYKKEV